MSFPAGCTWADLIRFVDAEGTPLEDPDANGGRAP